ncbi:MAG: zinc ribbon domain-containing protein [Anaerolineales bacterium]
MDLSSILIVMAIGILLVAFLAQPFLRGPGWPSTSFDKLGPWLAEKERLLGLLRDLDQDRIMGKLEPEAYEGQRADLTARAARVLRELDTHAVADGPHPVVGPGTCSNCGLGTRAGDRFCSHCGWPIQPGPG